VKVAIDSQDSNSDIPLMDNKELLYKAGKMADLALSLVGGMGLNGKIRPVGPDQFSEVALKLRAAVEDYNEAILSCAIKPRSL
jgi:hypothetical protein